MYRAGQRRLKSGHMRLGVLISVLIFLLLAGVIVGCGEGKDADQSTAGGVSKDQADQAVQGILGMLSPDMAQSFVDALSSLAATSAQNGGGLPVIAPLNQAFLDSLDLPAVDPASIEAVGYPLGLGPTAQDFLYARGIQIPSPPGFELPPTSYDLRETEAIPPTYDLVTPGKVTAVKDQNPYGTCWSFASLGSLESWLLPAETWDLSEDNMVLNSGFDTGDDPYNWGGTLEWATAYLVRWAGPVDERADAYGDAYTPAGVSPQMHVQEVNWIPPRESALDNNNVKNAILQYGGVYVALSWQGEASGSPNFDASTASYHYFGLMPANHAVLIVGWDDDYPAANFPLAPMGDGAFLVKNSWGTEFGDGGFFYVSYYDTVFGRSDLMGTFTSAESTGNYSGIYQYDPLGDVNGFGFESPTAWFANVFTAQATAQLSAVGFYALTPGTTYEVYAGSSPATMALSTTGTLAYMGYHTVALAEPVAVTRGEPFAVAVKITSPGTDTPIALEYPIDGYTSAATAQPGQSYVSADGGDWSDLTTTWDANANVCLKAYVK